MTSPRPRGRLSPRTIVSVIAVLGLTGCGSDGPTGSAVPSPPGDASGALILSMRTVGDQVDPDGYTAQLDQGPGVGLPVNGEVRISGLAPGAHLLDVGDVASNCRLTNRESPGSVSVSAGATVRVDLEVFCLQPDPGTIFFTQAGRVHVMNALGGDRRSLGVQAFKVEPSADQARIVFDWDEDVWVADVDGSNPINLTNSPDQREAEARWSPDRQRIVYEYNQDRFVSPSDIVVMKADGSGVTNLTPNTPDWGDSEPDWSPDGTRIAFRSGRSGGGDLWTMAPDGTQLAQLTHGSIDANPRFSPDGVRIVFTRFMGGLAEGGTDFDLAVINADGTGFMQLTSDDRRSVEADWSPDGRWIVFASADFEVQIFDLFVMRADGTDRLQLTFNDGGGSVTWVP